MSDTLSNGQSQKGNNNGSYRIIGGGLDFDPGSASAWRNASVNYQAPGRFGNVGTYSFTNSGSFSVTLNVHPTSGQIWTSNAMLYVYAPDPNAGGSYTVRSYPVGGMGSTSVTIPVGGPDGVQSLDQVSFAIVPTSGSTGFGIGISILKALGIATRSTPGINAVLTNPLYGVELNTTPPSQLQVAPPGNPTTRTPADRQIIKSRGLDDPDAALMEEEERLRQILWQMEALSDRVDSNDPSLDPEEILDTLNSLVSDIDGLDGRTGGDLLDRLRGIAARISDWIETAYSEAASYLPPEDDTDWRDISVIGEDDDWDEEAEETQSQTYTYEEDSDAAAADPYPDQEREEEEEDFA